MARAAAERLTPAVYPVYLLHFPVVLLGLAVPTETSWPWPAELLTLTAFTYGASRALYRLAARTGRAVWLIGGRPAAA